MGSLEELRRPVIHGLIYTVATGVSGMVGLIVFPILAHLLPVADIGKYDFFLFLLFSGVPIASLGFEYGIGAFAHGLAKEDINAVLKPILAISLLVAILESALLLGLKITGLFQSFSYFQIGLFAVSLTSLAFTYIFKSILIWKQHPIRASIVMRGEWLLASALGLACVLLCGLSITNYLLGFALAFALTVFLALAMWPFKGKPAKAVPILPLIKKIIPVALPYGITTTAWKVSLGIEKALILKELGPTQLGMYALAHKVGSIPQLLATNFLMGFLPELVKPKRNHLLYRALVRIYLAYSLILLGLVAWLSRPIVLIFGGERYLPSAQLLPWTTLAGLLALIPISINPILLKRKNTIPVLLTGTVSSVVTVVLGHALLKSNGLLGATIAVIVARLIGIGILGIIVYRWALQDRRKDEEPNTV